MRDLESEDTEVAATNGPEHVLKRTHLENAEFVLGELRALGFPPHPDSRLVKMRNALARGCVPFEDPDFPTALESLRDLQQLGFDFDQANASRAHTKFRDLTKKLLSDSALPQSDLDNSDCRDAQFELFLAAVCQKAGLLPVDYEEPDVLCTVN